MNFSGLKDRYAVLAAMIFGAAVFLLALPGFRSDQTQSKVRIDFAIEETNQAPDVSNYFDLDIDDLEFVAPPKIQIPAVIILSELGKAHASDQIQLTKWFTKSHNSQAPPTVA
jgi:hypothetical protein